MTKEKAIVVIQKLRQEGIPNSRIAHSLYQMTRAHYLPFYAGVELIRGLGYKINRRIYKLSGNERMQALEQSEARFVKEGD
jgi:hypothetical protein